MPPPANENATFGRTTLGIGNWLLGSFCLIGSVIMAFYLTMGFFMKQSLDRADCITLTESVRRWKEAGSLTGAKMAEFMQDRRSDMTATHRLFAIKGANYTTLLAVTRPSSGRTGTLFVTANGILIWLDASGIPRIVEFGGTPTKSPAVISIACSARGNSVPVVGLIFSRPFGTCWSVV